VAVRPLRRWAHIKDEPFASFINGVPKYIASTTVKEVRWGKYDNVTLLEGSLADALGTLKRKPGKNILVTGSPTLVRSLLRGDLLDELILMTHPVIAGKGKRLFADGEPLERLALVESETTPTGVIIARYRRR
jgi:dihydrofolate reductase